MYHNLYVFCIIKFSQQLSDIGIIIFIFGNKKLGIRNIDFSPYSHNENLIINEQSKRQMAEMKI